VNYWSICSYLDTRTLHFIYTNHSYRIQIRFSLKFKSGSEKCNPTLKSLWIRIRAHRWIACGYFLFIYGYSIFNSPLSLNAFDLIYFRKRRYINLILSLLLKQHWKIIENNTDIYVVLLTVSEGVRFIKSPFPCSLYDLLFLSYDHKIN